MKSGNNEGRKCPKNAKNIMKNIPYDREEMAHGEWLRQDVALLMAWTKEMEDGTTVMLSERLQRLEDRMAEKDQEIVNLREKVH